jgi:hypothetical protein
MLPESYCRYGSGAISSLINWWIESSVSSKPLVHETMTIKTLNPKLKKTQPDQPWAALDLQVHTNSMSMFCISAYSVLGDDSRKLFWSDKWF